MKTDPTFWLLARASGMTAYLLLTASVLAGLVLKARPFRSLKPAQVTDIHRFLALLGLGALALHGVTLVLDQAVEIPLVALLVPGMSPYRPLAVGIGVLAAELMLLVYASFSQRKRMGAKTWRRLHYASYVVFAASTAHGLLAGTDTQRPWALAVYLLAVGSVAAATFFRALAPKPTPPARAARPAAAGAPGSSGVAGARP
jgi:sulfoxide reductase heme-binding subunit YedZ